MTTPTPEIPTPDPQDEFKPAVIARRIFDLIEEPPVGRRVRLTPKKIETLLVVTMGGNYIEVACRFARISVASYYNYEKQAKAARLAIQQEEDGGPAYVPKRNDEPFLLLLESLEYATAHGEVIAAMELRKDSPKEFLTHRFRDRWHKKVELLADPEGGPLVHLIAPDNGRGPGSTGTPAPTGGDTDA
jgi:hypothetical protein